MNEPLRIGLIAEGEAELGYSIPYIKPQDGGVPIARQEEGALHTLIRREFQLMGIQECIFVQRHPTAKELRVQKRRTGFGILDPKYLAQTVIAWKPIEVDVIIIVADSDDQIEDRQTDLKRALSIVQANHFDEQDRVRIGRSCGGLAIKSFDTWLMADREAIQACLESQLSFELPEDLEGLPGDSQNSMCTKTIFENLISTSPKTGSSIGSGNLSLAARWQLAFIIDLERIKKHCKRGYLSFVAAMKDMVGPLSSTPKTGLSDKEDP